MAPRPFELRIVPKVEHVALVRAVIEGLTGGQPGVRTEDVDDLLVIVSELFTNAVAANAECGSREPVRIDLLSTAGHWELSVSDSGRGLPDEGVNAFPALSDVGGLFHEGGFGLPLVRALSDETSIRTSSSGTDVRVVKRFGAGVGNRHNEVPTSS